MDRGAARAGGPGGRPVFLAIGGRFRGGGPFGDREHVAQVHVRALHVHQGVSMMKFNHDTMPFRFVSFHCVSFRLSPSPLPVPHFQLLRTMALPIRPYSPPHKTES